MSFDHAAIAPKIAHLAERAAAAILEVYQSDFAVECKDDHSPLTAADLAAHHIIIEGLAALTPDIPVLSEESAGMAFFLLVGGAPPTSIATSPIPRPNTRHSKHFIPGYSQKMSAGLANSLIGHRKYSKVSLPLPVLSKTAACSGPFALCSATGWDGGCLQTMAARQY